MNKESVTAPHSLMLIERCEKCGLSDGVNSFKLFFLSYKHLFNQSLGAVLLLKLTMGGDKYSTNGFGHCRPHSRLRLWLQT